MATALRDLFSGTGASWAKGAFLEPQVETWSNPAGGGGYAHGQLTHALGLLLYITGLEIEKIFALTSASPTGADLYNAATCRFKGGAIGVVGGAATQPEGSVRQLGISIFGGEGMLLLDIERPRLELRRNDGQNFSMPITDDDTRYQCVEPLRTFVALIRGDMVENRSNATLGARVAEVLDALLRSAHAGREIVI
jgi:predicted dehydrogenase